METVHVIGTVALARKIEQKKTRKHFMRLLNLSEP